MKPALYFMTVAVLLGGAFLSAFAQPPTETIDTPSHRLLKPQPSLGNLSQLKDLSQLKGMLDKLKKEMDAPKAPANGRQKPSPPETRRNGGAPGQKPEPAPMPQPDRSPDEPQPRPTPDSPDGQRDAPPPPEGNGRRVDPTQVPLPSTSSTVPLPIPQEGLQERLQRILEEAKTKSRQEVRERRQPSVNPEQADLLRRVLSRIEVSEEAVISMLERFRRGETSWPQSEWWTNAFRRTSRWLEPLGRRANWLVRRIESLPGKLRISMPSASGFSVPSLGGSNVSPVNVLTIVGVLAAAVALGMIIMRPRRTAVTDEAIAHLKLKPIRPGRIRTREDLVKTVDTLALLRWGSPSRWWTHSRLADELAGLGRETADHAFTLAELYERARYARADAFNADHLQQAKAALRQLKIA